jgi:hypothetical protein
MKSFAKRVAGLLLLTGISFFLLDCRNPFTQVGLGDKLDLESPDLSVTSHSNGSYVKGTVNLSGTFADDFDGATVTISFDDGQSFVTVTDVDEEAGTWSYPLDTTLFPDGEKDVIVDITDSAGRVITNRLLLYFDNTPPLVLVKVPLGYDPAEYEFNGDVAIKGDATDRFPVERVEVEVPDFGISETAAGTNSWSFTFESENYVHGIGEYDFLVTAYDRAGNSSSYLYHTRDVADLNDGVQLSVEDLYVIDNGGSVSGTTLTKADLDTIDKSELTLRINQGLDLPQFDIYNPDPNALPEERVLADASKAIGMVTDDAEGIEPSSVQIQLDGGDWIAVDDTTGPGLAVRWEHSLTGLGEGPHTLRLRAQDTSGAQGLSNPVDFSIDSGVPVVEIDSPSLGAYLDTNSFTITGTAVDSGGTVQSVEVSIDDGATYALATSTSGDYDTWSYDVAGAPEGPLSIKAKATDDTSKVAYYNLQVIIDTEAPTATFLSPSRASSVNGPVTVRGACSDNRQVTQVELRIGEPENWIKLPDLYNWEYLFDSVIYANTTYATEEPAGSNIWKLDIYARVTDVAGNVTTTTVPADYYYIFIDQELDKPTVNIINPPAGTTSVGGPLLISGTALDDDGLDRVEMQINVNGDGAHAGDSDFADQVDFWDGSSNVPDGDTNDYFEREDAWYTASGTSLWSQEINNYGEMYNIGGGDGYIIVRVRAVDINGIVGDIEEFSIHLDDLIPRIESLNISSGEFVKGQFNITGRALDDDSIKQIFISYDGGINYESLPSDYYVMNSAKDYDLDIPVNTTDGGPITPALDIDSGILYLRLKITDFSNYQSITSLNLNVDNLYPSNAPDGYTADAEDINGTEARVQGTAQDAGTVSGIDKIEVYFVDGTTVYNPTTGATTAVGAHDFGDGNGPVDYPAGAGSENYKITIDDTNEFGNDGGGNGDGDGFDESLTLAGSTYNWWAEFDSNVIPDGELDIHYVVFDNSGNGSHYELAGFVKNHKPVIESVIVGSDVDHSNSVETDERFDYTEPFSARNRLYIEIVATDNEALPSSSYEVFHGALEFNDSSGTIDITQLPEYGDGGTSFLCRVTDSDGISVEKTIEVTVENTDSQPPQITIAPLTQSDVVDGHLENANSLHDGSDPDVSGTVELTGTASDNQRIESITVTIEDFDAGSGVAGGEYTVASWSGGSLVAASGSNFTIDSQTLTEGGGHQIGWIYRWNTAEITGAAKNNIDIRFEVNDFSPTSAANTTIVDVVPYISGIERTLNTHRSKYGKFQVQEGETGITIHGYNLAETGTNWVRVYNMGGTAYDTAIVTASGSPFTSMTVDLTDGGTDVAHSGWLRLMVNGVEAINNINDNSLTSNREDDGSGLASTKWTDDRYLRVWKVGDTFSQSQDPQSPTMGVDSNGTLYGAWTNSASSMAYYATTAARTAFFEKYDPPEYTDLYVDSNDNLNIAYLANYFNGNWSWGFMSLWNPSAPDQNNYNNYDAYLFEWLGADDMLFQFQRPRVVRSGNNLHLAYFDMNEKTMKYAYVLNGDNTTEDHSDTNGGGVHPHLNLDGGEAYPSGDGQSGPLTALAGEYVAIDVDENGYPLIMYYDISSQTLKLAYANAQIPTAYGDWTIQTVFKSDDGNKNYVGKYVSMKVDGNGNIHAVCSRTSSGSLIYLYAPDADGTDYSFDYSVEVDSEGAVGTWADITLNGTTPYISYLNNSMVGTFDGLKMAYYDNQAGDWEYEIVPIITGITENRTNVEYKKGAVDWQTAIGYASSNFDIVYLKPEE